MTSPMTAASMAASTSARADCRTASARSGVRLVDLSVRFGSATALDSVSHHFEPGTATAVMGINGSGKTTLLECLAGLLDPTAGRIEGRVARVGYVRQELPRAWMPLIAREVVAMGRYRDRGLLRWFRAGDRSAVLDAASRLGVAELLDQQYGELSSGQRRRVMIAQALATDPELLLLDEPISGLDIPSQERILAVLAASTARGMTVVITTHHLDEARHCDVVLLLSNRLVAAGCPETVLTPERLRVAFGARVLGDHADHDHDHELHVVDDHGHQH